MAVSHMYTILTMNIKKLLILIISFSLISASGVFADNIRKFQVISSEGDAYVINEDIEELNPGDQIKPGDTIKVSPNGVITLIMDNNEENIVRVGPSSDLFFKSTEPVEIEMLYGDIFSKLHALPKGEKYSVQTPLGVASVRGSIFQVEHRDQTLVSNFDKSLVTFESFDENLDVIDQTTIEQHFSIIRENIHDQYKEPIRIKPAKIELANNVSLIHNLESPYNASRNFDNSDKDQTNSKFEQRSAFESRRNIGNSDHSGKQGESEERGNSDNKSDSNDNGNSDERSVFEDKDSSGKSEDRGNSEQRGNSGKSSRDDYDKNEKKVKSK